MEDGNSMSGGEGGKSAGCRPKTPGISTSTRLQRNKAEKERRDKLNGFISELATLVPMVSNASKPLDKVSILRLAAAEMRLHFSCLNPKKYKKKPLLLPPAIMSSLDLIEKTIGGFVIVTTLTGLIVFCSRSIEDYLGDQNIDVLGNKVVKYVYEDDVKYFEAKVSSVVNSLKKGPKKKTKVIKAHMLQKPLPRSNDSCRPRNMIFKISVHQNDIGDNNGGGSSNHSTSIMKKTRSPKDFGYSAVVLMFIEPVRLEPEIDITYIDSNQDVYFTRHGLQGEIIYADQRISSITGYMSHDVQGTSAYQYICSSDVPIALFAQKAMFTSTDGKGDIVYRLRIRDMRFIYLQSSGQIAYKESSNEISHFVCFNRLLSEEEGSQELKKFQQRFAPQIMAAKMLQVKQNNASNESQHTDLALEHTVTLGNSPTVLDNSPTLASISSFQCAKVSPKNIILSGDSDQILSSDSIVSPSISSTAASSVHSSEGHSMTSPLSNERSSSVSSEYGGYASERMDFLVQKHEQRSPLSNSFIAAGACESVISVGNGKCISKENGLKDSDKNLLIISKSYHTENTLSMNGSYRLQQNDPYVNVKSQLMHSVNAFNNLQDSNDLKDPSEESLRGHPMDMNFDHEVLQENDLSFECDTSPNSSNVYMDKSDGLMLATNSQQNEYVICSEQRTRENQHLTSMQVRPAAQNILRDQQLNLNGEQIARNRPLHPQDFLSFSGMHEISSSSSLSQNSNNPLSVASDHSDTLDYCSSVNSYHEGSNRGNGYHRGSVGSYDMGASNESVVYSSDPVDVHNPRTFGAASSSCEMNGFHMSVSTVDVLARLPAMNSFDSMDTPMEMVASELTPERTLRNAEFRTADFPGTVNVKLPMTEYENGSSDHYIGMCGPDVTVRDWAGTHANTITNMDLALNEELYEELDLFFQNLPQSNNSPAQNTVVAADPVSEYSAASNASYPQNSISSSRAKRNYHQ